MLGRTELLRTLEQVLTVLDEACRKCKVYRAELDLSYCANCPVWLLIKVAETLWRDVEHFYKDHER